LAANRESLNGHLQAVEFGPTQTIWHGNDNIPPTAGDALWHLPPLSIGATSRAQERVAYFTLVLSQSSVRKKRREKSRRFVFPEMP